MRDSAFGLVLVKQAGVPEVGLVALERAGLKMRAGTDRYCK